MNIQNHQLNKNWHAMAKNQQQINNKQMYTKRNVENYRLTNTNHTKYRRRSHVLRNSKQIINYS